MGFDEARAIALERLKDETLAGRIAGALRGRFSEVIVDETQDCNPDDLTAISWLRDSGLPAKVVCDPHQAIYELRGGVTDHLEDRYPPATQKISDCTVWRRNSWPSNQRPLALRGDLPRQAWRKSCLTPKKMRDWTAKRPG